MEAYTGLGAWAGRAEGRILWIEPPTAFDRTPLSDRAAEIGRLKDEIGRAAADLDRWVEQQGTIEGRVVLQNCREALQDTAFTGRVTMLIDLHRLPAPAALVEAAGLVAGIMARSEELSDKAQALPGVARWLARRMEPVAYPPDVILAGREFSPPELLDRTHPALMSAGDPGVTGEAPLVWGLPDLSPEWDGRSVRIDGNTVVVVPEEEGRPVQYEAERRAVLEFARRMKRDGLVRLTSGNISCRIPGTTLFAITPSGMEYESLEPKDICVLDLSGSVVDGRRRPSTESPLHRLTYLRRSDVGAVIHTHSIYASAFACTGQDMPVISTELAGLVGGTIRCAPYAKAGTEEFAEVALKTLGHEDLAVLFQNHGVMAVGPTLKEAYDVAVGLEEAAMIYLLARQMGEPIILPEAERRRIFRVMHTDYGQVASPETDPQREA
ncbi:MAG: class II aldolase/adducin family protein [Bacillota bacterium]